MGRIDTDRKLELVRTIRLQNQYNRQLCRSRQQLLYSNDPYQEKGEIYGLESVAIPVSGGINRKRNAKTNLEKEQGSSLLKGFRIRLVIAMLLFLAFVFCDVKGIRVGKETMNMIFERMTETNLPDFFQSGLLGEKTP